VASSSAVRLFFHGGIYTLSRLANVALGVVLLPLYARHLGTDGFGTISLMATVGGFLGLVIIQGLPGAWFRLRFDEADEAGIRKFETTIVWYLIASGLGIVGLVTLLGTPLSRWVTPGIPYLPLGLLTASAAFANVFPALYERKLQVEERPVAFGIFNLGRTLLQAALVVVFVVALDRGARGAIEATTLAAGINMIGSLIMIHPGSWRLVSKPRLARSPRLRNSAGAALAGRAHQRSHRSHPGELHARPVGRRRVFDGLSHCVTGAGGGDIAQPGLRSDFRPHPE
jgi:O-antigen/teichoic acid export membrane protein